LCESYNRQYKDSHGLDYRSVMPTNLYGPGDNYHSLHSHVIPALIKRFHEAKINNYPEVIIWGTGQVKREFLFVDDMAKASIHVMQLSYELYNTNILEMQSHINIGSGDDVTIKFLAELISKVVNYKGIISYDSSKSDGAPRKLMDNGLIRKLGWVPEVTLEDGLQTTYNDFLNNKNSRI
jgi:GDP-L-fucose synthase